MLANNRLKQGVSDEPVPLGSRVAPIDVQTLWHRGLVISFGMGTSYRSMLSWGIDSTVVELAPSIPALLPYFHDDGDTVLRDPKGTIVIDDGRRFLERSAT